MFIYEAEHMCQRYGLDESKDLGYSSRIKPLKGFRDYPDCFRIHKLLTCASCGVAYAATDDAVSGGGGGDNRILSCNSNSQFLSRF